MKTSSVEKMQTNTELYKQLNAAPARQFIFYPIKISPPSGFYKQMINDNSYANQAWIVYRGKLS